MSTKPTLGISTLCAWKEGKTPKLFQEMIKRNRFLWEIVDESDLAIRDEDATRLWSIRRDYQVTFSVHVPFIRKDIFSDNLMIRSSSINSVKRSIEMANKYEAKFAVIHPGYKNELLTIEEVSDILNDLFDFCYSLGIIPLLENLTKGSIFYRPEDITLLRKLILRPGFVLDVGHANVENNLKEFLRVSANFSYFHLHDNFGRRDEHLPVGMGSVDWNRFFSEVMKSNPTAPLVVEHFSIMDVDRSLILIKQILQ